MKPVYHTPNATEAALIRGFLEENGIEAVLVNDGLGLAYGEIPIDPSTMPTVLVPEADAARAEALIEERSGWIDDEGWGPDEVRGIDSEEEEE